MPGGGEVLADDLGENPRFGPDPDRRDRAQDLMKRVGLHDGLDLGMQCVPGSAQIGKHPGQLRQHHGRSIGPGRRRSPRPAGSTCAEPAVSAGTRPTCAPFSPGPGWARVRSRSSTAGWSSRGPRTRSSAGWIWVSSPRIRLDVAVACLARSSSKPQSMDNSATCSSATRMERRVWGMVRAAMADGNLDTDQVPWARMVFTSSVLCCVGAGLCREKGVVGPLDIAYGDGDLACPDA